MDNMLCAGKGQNDSRAVSGNDYDTVTFQDIVTLAQNPRHFGDKAEGFWVIPSSYYAYDARTRRAQLDKGVYHLLWADIDGGPNSIEPIVGLIGRYFKSFLIYTTYNHKPPINKYRVMIPTQPIPGAYYEAAATVLNDLLQPLGTIDRANQGTAQLCYLPNVPDPTLYQHFYQPGEPHVFHDQDYFSQAIRDYLQKEQPPAAPPSRPGPRDYFNSFYPAEIFLSGLGFITNDGGRNWHHPDQTTSSYATIVWPDGGWSTRSETVKALLGKDWGDSFDLFALNNPNAQLAATALPYGWQLGDDPAAVLEYHRSTGEALFARATCNGVPVGPALLREIHATAMERATNIQPVDKELVRGEWDIPWPPGMMGELAYHMYRTSKKPIRQYAIAAAFLLMSGIASRRYIHDNMGLNLYFVIGGMSGSGKGQARTSIDRIIPRLANLDQNPAITEVFSHGFPASGPALKKLFSRTTIPIAVTYQADAEYILDTLASEQSIGINLKDALNELWDKSGAFGVQGSTEYSDADNSVAAIIRPSLTVGLDTQLDPLKAFLGSRTANSSGIGARMLFIEYDGHIVPTNYDSEHDLPEALEQRLLQIWQAARNNFNQTVPVAMFPDVQELSRAFEEEMRIKMNNNEDMAGYMNRTAMNVIKISALIAVINNPHTPVITREDFLWAKDFVLRSANRILELVATGETGTGESVRIVKAMLAIKRYKTMSPSTRRQYQTPRLLSDIDEIISENYLKRTLTRQAAFKGTDNGKTTLKIVEETLDQMVRDNLLVEVSKLAVMERYQIVLASDMTTKLYSIGSAWE